MTADVPVGGLSRRAFLTTAASLAVAACGRTPPPRPDFDCDACIIGSGFAGVYLAQRLAERGLRVIVIEAGPRLASNAPGSGAADLFPAVSTGTLVFPVNGTRTIGLGGTSRQWNGVITRLLPDDLRVKSRRGLDVDWPVGYDDLEPYYCDAEQMLQVSGGLLVPDAEPPRCPYPSEAGDYESPAALLRQPDLPVFPLAFALANGRPLRLDEGPMEALRQRPNVTILEGHPVTGLAFASDGRLLAVEARPEGQPMVTLRPRAAVIAAGVVETTRLLLHARETRPSIGGTWLGAGFHAHPRYRVQVRPRARLPRVPRIHRSYMRHPKAFEGRGAFLADFHLDTAVPQVDVTLELAADAANGIRLAPNARDRWGRRSVALNADWTPRDIETREAALNAQLAFANALGRPTAEPGLRWFHPAGTCRMAAAPEDGVVDPQLRVFQTTNLFLSGAAVFPTSGATNPTLTVVALSLRLADHLTQLIRSESNS